MSKGARWLQFSSRERQVLEGALRVGMEQYEKDADATRPTSGRVASQFVEQARECERLLEELEGV